MQDALGKQHIVTVWCLECQIWGCWGTHKRGTEGISLRGVYKLNHTHKRPQKEEFEPLGHFRRASVWVLWVSMESISLADLPHLMHMRAGSVHYKPDCSRYHDIQGGTSKKRLQGTGLGLLGTHPQETRGAGKYLKKTQCSYLCTCSLPGHQVLVTLQKITSKH